MVKKIFQLRIDYILLNTCCCRMGQILGFNNVSSHYLMVVDVNITSCCPINIIIPNQILLLKQKTLFDNHLF